MKSSPAPIALHPGVQAILAMLDTVAGKTKTDLPSHLATAAEAARRAEEADAAALAEARGWLVALAAAETVRGDRGRLLEAVALSTEADFRDARADRVSLLTMHAAKGLEFAVVFIVGMEAGLVPFSSASSLEEDARTAAEERRLFYVAMTRAKDRLFLTRAAGRFWRGAARSLPPSPFLAEIATELVTTEAVLARKRRQARQPSLFWAFDPGI